MTEWSVVGVIVVLVGLFFAIYTPISKNTKENTEAMTELSGSSCTWATCKVQSDGTVYVAMRNWTTSAANIHPEYTAVYLKK